VKDIKPFLTTLLVTKFKESDYLYLFDYVIKNINRVKNSVMEYVIPTELSTLAEAFIGENAGKVYIPFGGFMNFATEIQSFKSLNAQEVNEVAFQIGLLRLGLGDAFNNVNYTNEHYSWNHDTFDTIISMPPLGLRISTKDKPKGIALKEEEDSETYAPYRFLESASENGICVAFAPASLLFLFAKKKFRAWTIQNNILDTVIQLPRHLLYGTSVPLCCIILRKKPKHEKCIRLIDASGMFVNVNNQNRISVGAIMEAYHADIKGISATISYDDIVNMEYIWSVDHYLQKEPVDCPEGYTISKLEEIVEMPRPSIASSRDMGLVVRISDLSDDWTQVNITSSLKEYRNVYNSLKLTRKAVLISSVVKLRPSIVEASEEKPVWVDPSVMILIPKDNIDMEFLCMTLAKQKVPILNTLLQRISRTYLLRLDIAYPALEVQKSIYKEACYAYKLSQAKENGLQEIIEQMKTDYINEVRARKHDMKTPMTQLSNTLTLIEYMAKSLPKESAAQLLKYVERQKKAIGTLKELVRHIADEDHFAQPEVLNVEELLKGYVEKTDKYVIDYHCDKLSLSEAGIEVPQVKMGKLDFLRLADNIVSNAIQRGFTKDYPEYALNITLSVNGEFFVIDFSNNGEPLPNGMDKERYGTKGAKGVDSDGTGTGGYIVKSITRHYGGDYDVRSAKLMGIDITNIIVKLPIYRGEDE
jgi:type I restriction enzyme M protein